MEKCMRRGVCCCGIPMYVGIHLSGLLILVEFVWLFATFIKQCQLDFRWLHLLWVLLATSRAFFYLRMCADSITTRKVFFLVMLATTLCESLIVVLNQITLFDKQSDACDSVW